MSHPRIQAVDFDYVGAFLFENTAVDPESMAVEDDLSGYAEMPPPISGYRKADIAGLACWNCGHFTPKGDFDNDGDVDGICNLFEAKAEGEFTCDRFTAHADLFRQSPHTSWSEDMQAMLDRNSDSMGPSIASVDYSDNAVLNEIRFASAAVEEEGLVWKDILRTGEWKQTPTTKGIIDKKLQIVKDGESDPVNGVISLSEIYRNFNDRAVPYVTIPLSDDLNDHKNIARLNTGFVRKLKLVERDGMTVLMAGMDFTEPDVKGKVLRGTIPDVSAGVPFGVTRRDDKKTFTAVLDHVCLTRKPFVSNLRPFGIAAADGDDIPVEAWEQTEVDEIPADTSPPSDTADTDTSATSLSFRKQQASIRKALTDQLRLGPEYQVEDIDGSRATVAHLISGAVWEVPFRLDGDIAIVATADSWKLIEEQHQEEPLAASDLNKSEIERARELRELRFAQPTSNTGGIQMSVLKLDGVELSDETRASIQTLLDENASLKQRNREAEVNKRIDELSELGLKDRPGALKLYRQIMLSDDGGPAVVLFSDSEGEKERLTAQDILDRFIAALKADGGVVFSDQHFSSGNDKKPADDASGERPLDERLADSKEALYGKRNRRK